jgi:hypothetical protein
MRSHIRPSMHQFRATIISSRGSIAEPAADIDFVGRREPEKVLARNRTRPVCSSWTSPAPLVEAHATALQPSGAFGGLRTTLRMCLESGVADTGGPAARPPRTRTIRCGYRGPEWLTAAQGRAVQVTWSASEVHGQRTSQRSPQGHTLQARAAAVLGSDHRFSLASDSR